MKKTTFNVTVAALELENLLIEKMDISRASFHRRMIDYYLKYDRTINPNLLIKKRNNPNYVKKDTVEQIYLDENREKALAKIAEKYSTKDSRCGIGTVLFQALLSYCVVQSSIVFGEGFIKRMLGE